MLIKLILILDNAEFNICSFSGMRLYKQLKWHHHISIAWEIAFDCLYLKTQTPTYIMQKETYLE